MINYCDFVKWKILINYIKPTILTQIEYNIKSLKWNIKNDLLLYYT